MNKEIFDLYQQFHQIPEIGLEEIKTTQLIVDILTKRKIQHERLNPTGVIAYIKGSKSETIALRCEIDGLPIIENVNSEYKSNNNNMHACGHDLHISWGIQLLTEYLKNPKGKNLVVIFQPAEENAAGASLVVNSGKLQKYNISQLYTFHVHPELENGKIGYRPGVFLATNASFQIRLSSNKVHAVLAHGQVNQLDQAVTIYSKIKDIKILNDEIINIGSFHGGNVPDDYPDEVILKGTIRSFDSVNILKYKAEIFKIIDSYANAKCDFKLSYPVIKNSEKVINSVIEREFDFKLLPKYLHVDDFGFYGAISPICYLTFGIKQLEYQPIHSDKFTITNQKIEIPVLLILDILKD
jgi:amidohydrolase